MQVFFEDDQCRISYEEEGAKTSAFCFTGIGLGLGGITDQDLQKEEFKKSFNSSGCNRVYVIDKMRTWYASSFIRTKLQEFLDEIHAKWGVDPTAKSRHCTLTIA